MYWSILCNLLHLCLVMACKILHSSWMDAEEMIEQDADMFPELNGHTTLQDKINAERKAANNMNVQQTESASEELSSDEYTAADVVTAATVVDGENAKEGLSTIQSDEVEITLDDQSDLNDVAVDDEPANKDKSELTNIDQPELTNDAQPGLANLVPETGNVESENELDTEEEKKRKEVEKAKKKEVEKAKKETKKNNRNFQNFPRN